jgi:hypothetical protein
MKGNNEMHLNEATMKVALQFWLNSVMVAPVPSVDSVTVEDNRAGYSTVFIIHLKEAEAT